MAVLAYTRYALTSADPYTNRAAGTCLYFYCDTEAERPSGTSSINGDSAYTVDTGKRWDRTGGAWVLRTTDNLANAIMDASGDVFDIADLTDGQFLKRVGAEIVSEAIAAGGDMLKSENLSGLANYTTARSNMGLGTAAVTNATAYATAAQGATADSALQPAGNGSSLTGLTKTQVGLANVDNTSDAAKPVSTATQTALDAKQATLVSATNIKTINGSTVLGSGDLVVTGAAPAFTAFTKDLGVSRRGGTFDITGLSGLTTGKVVSVVQTADAIASKGNAVDEYEMDPITLTGTVLNTTTIRANWACAGGRNVAVGTYAFAYQVSG